METKGELSNLIWTTTFGQLLIEKGVLTREEVTAKLQSFRDAINEPQIMAEIDTMIRAVAKW